MGKNRNKNKSKKGNNAGLSNKGKIAQQTTSLVGHSFTTSLDTTHSKHPTSRRSSGVTTDPTVLDDSMGAAKVPASAKKRDSVISSTWEERRNSLAAMLEPVKPRRWELRPRHWWPCRTYRWTRDFIFAFYRACTGPRWPDVLLTLFTVAIAMFAGYVAVELALSMTKTASAQSTTADTGCSIVYVNIPGPIVTVSLVNTSPSNPAHGTYYFSVVNGTTGWLNSVAPPSQFSTLITRTPNITPVISSVSVTPSTGGLSDAQPTPTLTSSYTNTPPLTSPSSTSPSISTSSSLPILSPTIPSISSSLGGSSVTITITSIVSGGQTTTLTSITPTTLNSVLPVPSGSAVSPATSNVILTLTSTIPGRLTTTLTGISTTTVSAPFVGLSPSYPVVSSSNVLVTLTSTLPGGPPTTMTITSVVVTNPSSNVVSSNSASPTISSIFTTLTSALPGGQTITMILVSTTTISAAPSAANSSSSLASSSNPGGPSSSGSFTISLPNPSSGPSSAAATTVPSIATYTITRVTSGLTTTLTLLSTTSASATVSSSSLSSSWTSSGTTALPSTASGTTSNRASSSMFSWPSSLMPVSATPSSMMSLSSSSSLNRTSTSTLSSSSIISTTTTTGGIPGSTLSSVFVTVILPTNTTSSSLNITTTSSTSSTSFSSSLIVGSGSISTVSVSGSMTIQTSTPTGTGATSAGIRDLTTRIISYGGTVVSFVFPTPAITTTVSYWTGLYPTVTGPMPSDLPTIVPTTRSTTQTPISALPSFQEFSSKTRSFRTVVSTIWDDEGPGKRNEKRQADPRVLQSLVSTTLQIGTPTSGSMFAVQLPGPTSCGESGNFTLNFDDTTVDASGDQIIEVNGLRNPYHHLFYANGYTDIPDKWEPYPAISQPNVAMYLPGLVGRLLTNQPFAGTLLPGEMGAGPRASVDAYWFNAYSGYFGCALNGLQPCQLQISGYRYDATLKTEVLVAQQNATLPACPLYIHCSLTQVLFNTQFQALSGIQFQAYTGLLGVPQIHFMDDLQLEWYNNTCSAGILRIGRS